jgi:hypothetical protein
MNAAYGLEILMAQRLLHVVTFAIITWHATSSQLVAHVMAPPTDQAVERTMAEFARIDVSGEIRVSQLAGLSFPEGTDPHRAPRDSAFGVLLETPSEVRWEMKYTMDGRDYWLVLMSSSSKPELRGDADNPLAILGYVGATSYHYYREGGTAYVSTDQKASVPWLIGVARLDGILGRDLSADSWFESRLGVRQADVTGVSSSVYDGDRWLVPWPGIPAIHVSTATVSERSAHRIPFVQRRMLVHRLSNETAIPLVVEMRRGDQLRQRVQYQWRQAPQAKLGVALTVIQADQFYDFTRNLGPEVASDQTKFVFNPDSMRVGEAASGIHVAFPAGTAVEQRGSPPAPAVKFDPVQVVKERNSVNLFFVFAALALFLTTTLLGLRWLARSRREAT